MSKHQCMCCGRQVGFFCPECDETPLVTISGALYVPCIDGSPSYRLGAWPSAVEAIAKGQEAHPVDVNVTAFRITFQQR